MKDYDAFAEVVRPVIKYLSGHPMSEIIITSTTAQLLTSQAYVIEPYKAKDEEN